MVMGRNAVMEDVSHALEKPPSIWAGLWERQQTALTRLAAICLVLAVWEWVVRTGKVNPLFLSSPSRVFAKLYQVFLDGSIWPHIGASAEIAGLGFGLSVLFGVPIGIAMGRSKFIRDSIEPFVMASYASPTVAFLPLIILWLGLGVWSKVVLVLLGGIFVIIINTEVGVSSIDRRLTGARSFSRSFCRLLCRSSLPAFVLPSAVC